MKKLFIAILSCYQTTISFLIGGQCRFYPSCSAYAKEAIEKKGVLVGLWQAFCRLTRCHPLHAGGYDPVTDNK